MAYSPDGTRIASGSVDNTFRVWDAASGVELACLRGHEGRVCSVAYSPDGTRIVSRSYRKLRVSDVASGECLEMIEGAGDVAAIAAGESAFPLGALARGLETVVESAKGRPLAFFPAMLGNITTDPSGRRWTGQVSNYLCPGLAPRCSTHLVMDSPALAVAL